MAVTLRSVSYITLSIFFFDIFDNTAIIITLVLDLLTKDVF